MGRRLPRGDRRTARRAARLDARSVAGAVRGARVRRHGARSGTRLRAVRGPRMDWQEHVRHSSGDWIVDLSRGDRLQPAVPG